MALSWQLRPLLEIWPNLTGYLLWLELAFFWLLAALSILNYVFTFSFSIWALMCINKMESFEVWLEQVKSLYCLFSTWLKSNKKYVFYFWNAPRTPNAIVSDEIYKQICKLFLLLCHFTLWKETEDLNVSFLNILRTNGTKSMASWWNWFWGQSQQSYFEPQIGLLTRINP